MFRGRRRALRSWVSSPHARGDVPFWSPRSSAGHSFSPRPWGCSVVVGGCIAPDDLLPTPVGMFRPKPSNAWLSRTSPHARGDVPKTTSSARSPWRFSPRPWGCSATHQDRNRPQRLLPTPVGMFRTLRPSRRGRPPSPHARGDVPLKTSLPLRARAFSPRPWGCSASKGPVHRTCNLLPTPVGMFRPKEVPFREIGASPHARGDVPSGKIGHYWAVDFSPRPWGCSEVLEVDALPISLLPTPVGMFRVTGHPILFRNASPHARGDVPAPAVTVITNCHFSPRPWGCSDPLPRPSRADALLPTPVGMFRRCTCRSRRWPTSPHARGDVPVDFRHSTDSTHFSPRPWGCSGYRRRDPTNRRLLPTPVGMFREEPRTVSAAAPSPHARGDVPCMRRGKGFTQCFSPRPWGCSGSAEDAERQKHLLPTPVGMFRSTSTSPAWA